MTARRSRSFTRRLRVERRVWDADDTYLAVPGFQVFEEDGFCEGVEVEVTVTLIRNAKPQGVR